MKFDLYIRWEFVNFFIGLSDDPKYDIFRTENGDMIEIKKFANSPFYIIYLGSYWHH